ncbi:RDD family protein [Agromyces tropicus]|uniref:RDD family protein n=1 Tax=Agromyces tropicus TaxID=555371 RepID=UPI0031DD6EDB
MSITMEPADPVPGTGADGRPDPAFASALGLVPAPTGRRSAAFAVDAAVWAIVAVPALVGWVLVARAALDPGTTGEADAAALVAPLVLAVAGQLLLAVLGIVQLALHGRRGVTIGKASFGLRSVQVATFARPGFRRVVLRALVLWSAQAVLPAVGPAVCFASGLWDPESRGRSWLDRIGRCWVVDARRGLDPFDAKALRHARRALDASPAADRAPLPSLATDRGVDDRTFIPAARSSSGVVAAPASTAAAAAPAAGAWTPPPIASPPAAPPAPPTPAPVARRAATLVFADGARYAASGLVLLGRSPASADADRGDVALLPLADGTMGLSKTHAAVEVGPDGIRVTDRWSRNGTAIVDAAGVERELEPGVPHAVPAGAAVRLGGLEFRVEEARA